MINTTKIIGAVTEVDKFQVKAGNIVSNLKVMLEHEGLVSGWIGNKFGFNPSYFDLGLAAFLAWLIQRKLVGGIIGLVLWIILTTVIWGGLVSLGL